MLEPARIYLGGGVAVDLLKLGAQKAELDVQGQLSPLAVRISLRQVQPALVNVLIPNLLAAGVIEAPADLHGSWAPPVGGGPPDAFGVPAGGGARLGLP